MEPAADRRGDGRPSGDIADDQRTSAQHMTAIGHHHDADALADVVLPAIGQRSGCDITARLLVDLPHHAAVPVLAPATAFRRQFPLAPLVLQQQG